MKMASKITGARARLDRAAARLCSLIHARLRWTSPRCCWISRAATKLSCILYVRVDCERVRFAWCGTRLCRYREDTLDLDERLIEDAITQRARAIVLGFNR
jgi:hypothetical protein